MDIRKKPKTFIINDDPIQLKVTKSILEGDGWNVVSFQEVESALKNMINNCLPDVIVTGLHMQGIDGWRFCRLLRSPEFSSMNNIPILVISDTFSGADTYKMSIEQGANAFLEIPYKPATLKRIMKNLFKGEIPAIEKEVLIVENDKNFANLLEDSFKLNNFIVHKASNLNEGKELLKLHKFHSVIINYDLPDGNGDEILKDIKTPLSWTTKILTIEAPTPDLALQFVKNGADASVRKPCNPQYLVELCNKTSRERSLFRVKELQEDHIHKLKRNENKFRILFESSKDAIYFSSKNGTILDVNQSALNLFGYTREEMLKLNSRDLYVNPKDREKFIKEIEENKAIVDYEEILHKKDGSEIACLVSSSIRYDENGSVIGYQGIIRDITGRKNMEKELLKMEKLESISVLAGGIAHDFNNILTAILGNLSLSKFLVEHDSEVYEKLDEAEKASLRAKGLTQQLLTFSKGGAPIKKVVSIKDLLLDSSKFAPIDSEVTCNLMVEDDLWVLEIDVSQISQVINNLIINADQAMPSGGIIDISAQNVVLDKNLKSPMKPGKFVNIKIKDHGIGISKENLDKIFDPYYTTKQRGSGFGLASAYSVIKNHKGFITVNSKVGVGTTFDIFLPSIEKKVTEKKQLSDKPEKGSGKVLIMDDEEIIRDIAESMLNYIGYKVVKTIDGDEAFETYKKAQEQNEPFDAVIMDLTIPGGLGGKEAVRKIIELDPDVKAIVSSGYSNDPIMSNYEKYGFKAVISKPYKIEELSDIIKQVLNKNK